MAASDLWRRQDTGGKEGLVVDCPGQTPFNVVVGAIGDGFAVESVGWLSCSKTLGEGLIVLARVA